MLKTDNDIRCQCCNSKIDLVEYCFFGNPDIQVLKIKPSSFFFFKGDIKEHEFFFNKFVTIYSKLLSRDLDICLLPPNNNYFKGAVAVILVCGPDCKDSLSFEITSSIHDRLRDLKLFDAVVNCDRIAQTGPSFTF